MLRLLSSGGAVIEDMDNEIIYVISEGGSIRIIEGYKDTYTGIEHIPVKVMMPIMKLMLEKVALGVRDKSNSMDTPEMIQMLSEGLSIVEQLNKGGLIE